MAQTVKLTTYDCGTNKCIKVSKHLVRTKNGIVVKFHNKLDGIVDVDAGVDAKIQFFDADDKGSDTPLSGFCTEVSGDTLLAAKGKKTKCTLSEVPGDYAYTVKAEGHLDLDPIIIIEPSVVFFTTSAVICTALAALAALLGFQMGMKKNRSAA